MKPRDPLELANHAHWIWGLGPLVSCLVGLLLARSALLWSVEP